MIAHTEIPLAVDSEVTHLDGSRSTVPKGTMAHFSGGEAFARRIEKHGPHCLLIEKVKGLSIPCRYANFVGLN